MVNPAARAGIEIAERFVGRRVQGAHSRCLLTMERIENDLPFSTEVCCCSETFSTEIADRGNSLLIQSIQGLHPLFTEKSLYGEPLAFDVRQRGFSQLFYGFRHAVH